MTIGQRIAQKRREHNLSQEALGEHLGVSRQSIYKWESDAALPEIDKLITLSRLFSVTVGWLLGVEEAAPAATATPGEPAPENSAESAAPAEDLTETQLQMVQEIVDRYLAAQPTAKRRKRWPVALGVLVLFCALLSLFNRLENLSFQYNNLQNSVSHITSSMDNQIGSIAGRVEEVLKSQNNLTADYSTEILRIDPKTNTATFTLFAVPKTATEGMTVLFQASDGMGGNQQATGEKDSSGQKYAATVACTLTDNISLSVIFVRADGTQETQLLENYEYLYSASLPALTVEDYGNLMGTTVTDGKIALSNLYVTTQEQENTWNQDEIPAAKMNSIRVGLFKNKKLVSWATPCAQPEHFQGFDDSKFYQLPDQTLSMTPNDVVCFAAVVTDEYDRSIMAQTPNYVLGERQEMTWQDDQKMDFYPANWTF